MRMDAPKGLFADNNLIRLKDENWLEKQRVAGKVSAKALILLEQEVKNRTTKSLLELDKLAETYIRDNQCEPTFLGYHGFPNSTCISVNKKLVHGIPTDYKLQDGDLVSFDLGATYQGAIADTAITCTYGETKSKYIDLINATKESLRLGIEAAKIGNRLGCIGEAIYKYANSKGYGVIDKYGGHGIDMTDDGIGIPHAPPFVANKSSHNEGIRIVPGLVIAIEPMLTIGSTKTYTDKDGWTVWCEAEMSAHEEHTLFIHENIIEIITDRNK